MSATSESQNPVSGAIPVGEHPLPERHAFEHDNRLLLWIIAVLVVALVVVGLVAFAQPNGNGVARAKAIKLEALLKKEGLPLPTSLSVFSNSLGTNGGLVCAATGYNLTDAILNEQNSAGSGGLTASRVLPIERSVLSGQLAIIDVYCPSKAAAFTKHFGAYTLYTLTK
jgi:hypothetical protein